MLYMRHIQEVNKKKNKEIESLTKKYERFYIFYTNSFTVKYKS